MFYFFMSYQEFPNNQSNRDSYAQPLGVKTVSWETPTFSFFRRVLPQVNSSLGVANWKYETYVMNSKCIDLKTN